MLIRSVILKISGMAVSLQFSLILQTPSTKRSQLMNILDINLGNFTVGMFKVRTQ